MEVERENKRGIWAGFEVERIGERGDFRKPES
jgi:hypothetical protein